MLLYWQFWRTGNEYQKFSSRTIGSWLYCSRFLVYGQKEDSILMMRYLRSTDKKCKIKGLSWYLTRKKIRSLIRYTKGNRFGRSARWTGITSFTSKKMSYCKKLNGSDAYFCHLDQRPVKWINKFHEKRRLILLTLCSL
jgi:hypothetical protein